MPGRRQPPCYATDKRIRQCPYTKIPSSTPLIDRTGTWASKWRAFEGRDVLPFPVADMEFRAPRFILDAVSERLAHGVLGYTETPAPLEASFCDWVDYHYGWRPEPAWLVWMTGVVAGLNLTARAVGSGSLITPTPVYHPFLAVPGNVGRPGIEVQAVLQGGRWVMDFDALEAAVRQDTRLFMLCNPQNPTGRVFERSELERVAEFAERHDLIICSDDIHSGLTIAPGTRHVPIASLSPEVARRTVSLFAATKTYNIPGLGCAVAVIPDAALRERFVAARAGLIHGVGPLAYAASQAAFDDRTDWLDRLLRYLHANATTLYDTVDALPGVTTTPVEGTYLAWIDVRELGLEDPGAYFEAAGLALSDGDHFRGPGFVRFNFACPRSLLQRGLDRFATAVHARS